MPNSKIRRFIPFIIIFVAVVYLNEVLKQGGPLSFPKMNLVAPAMRSANNTEFTLPDLSGKATRLSDFRGNVVLLNFFATWCPPCREEMPTIENVFRAYKHKDFVVLGIAGDTKGKEVVEPFVKEYEMTFPVVLDTKSVVSKQYNVRGIPAIYLLDRQGRIAGTHVGGADWNSEEARALIEQLLQES